MPPGSLKMLVVVEHPAGGVGCVRDRPVRREGECGPGAEAKASSDAQGAEGEYNFFGKLVCVLAQFALGFLMSSSLTLT